MNAWTVIKKFSVILSISEHEKTKVSCPKCKGKKVQQSISTLHDQDQPEKLRGPLPLCHPVGTVRYPGLHGFRQPLLEFPDQIKFREEQVVIR